jgi:hypothetical protein
MHCRRAPAGGWPVAHSFSPGPDFQALGPAEDERAKRGCLTENHNIAASLNGEIGVSTFLWFTRWQFSVRFV